MIAFYQVRHWAGQVAGTEISQGQEEERFQLVVDIRDQVMELGSRKVSIDPTLKKDSLSSKLETTLGRLYWILERVKSSYSRSLKHI